VVIIVFGSASAAYGASAELKRLYTAQTWGDIEVRRVGDHAEMTLPPHSWRDPQLREIIRRSGVPRPADSLDCLWHTQHVSDLIAPGR